MVASVKNSVIDRISLRGILSKHTAWVEIERFIGPLMCILIAVLQLNLGFFILTIVRAPIHSNLLEFVGTNRSSSLFQNQSSLYHLRPLVITVTHFRLKSRNYQILYLHKTIVSSC